MKLWLWLALGVVFCTGVGLWWDLGHGQAWAATFTGTDYCSGVPPKYVAACTHENFWAGFGGTFPWVLFSLGGLFTGLALAFRHTNCHVKGCWRLGKHQLAGGEFKVCGKHSPSFVGRHASLAEIHKLHHSYLGAKPGKG